jgi:hypothetical protein
MIIRNSFNLHVCALNPTCLLGKFLGSMFFFKPWQPAQVLGGTYTGTIASYNIKYGRPPKQNGLGRFSCGSATRDAHALSILLYGAIDVEIRESRNMCQPAKSDATYLYSRLALLC